MEITPELAASASNWINQNIDLVDEASAPGSGADHLVSLEDVKAYVGNHSDAPEELAVISESPENWGAFLASVGQPMAEGSDPNGIVYFADMNMSEQASVSTLAHDAMPSGEVMTGEMAVATTKPAVDGHAGMPAGDGVPSESAALSGDPAMAHGEAMPTGMATAAGVPAHQGHESMTIGDEVPLHDTGSHHFATEYAGHGPSRSIISAVGQQLGLPSIEDLKGRMDALGFEGFTSPMHPEETKLDATYTVLAALEKIKMLPPSTFGGAEEGGINKQAGLVYGSLKMAALSGDANAVRDILRQNGGNDFGLSDAQLLHVWGNAEGWNLHTIIQPGAWVGNAIHMTGLNYADTNPDDGITWDPARASGGYNDTGMASQWGWFEGALKLEDWTR
ncbi:MAG: hypothetical protein RIR70_40 [Pseudomonadota bacterium]|jgi:hypothetical protein